MVSESQLARHRRTNLVHSVALFGGLGALCAVVGFLLSGWLGALFALGMAVAGTIVAARVSRDLVLRSMRARPVSPARAPELALLVDRLSRRGGLRRRPELFWIPSDVPNALSVGHRDAPVIAVTDGLLRRLSPREVAGVLAHEIGHIANGDLWVMGTADGLARVAGSLGQMGMFLALFSICMGSPRFLGVAVLLSFVPTLATLLMMGLSRQREYAADLAAVQITGDPGGLASALERIEQPHRLLRRVFGLQDEGASVLRSHPHTTERVARLHALEVDVAPLDLGRLDFSIRG